MPGRKFSQKRRINKSRSRVSKRSKSRVNKRKTKSRVNKKRINRRRKSMRGGDTVDKIYKVIDLFAKEAVPEDRPCSEAEVEAGTKNCQAFNIARKNKNLKELIELMTREGSNERSDGPKFIDISEELIENCGLNADRVPKKNSKGALWNEVKINDTDEAIKKKNN